MLKRHRPSLISRERALKAVKNLISYIGDDPNRSGLKDTPDRVLRAWEQSWGLGYRPEFIRQQKLSIMKAQFDDHEDYDQMICLRDISYVSFCEHHMVPFFGRIDVAYIPSPNGTVLGLSKLVRIVELYTHKLQVQERLTNQIADYLWKNLSPLGVGVVVRGTHLCMVSRGVLQPNAEAVTQALRGEMLTKQEVREEFLQITKRSK